MKRILLSLVLILAVIFLYSLSTPRPITEPVPKPIEFSRNWESSGIRYNVYISEGKLELQACSYDEESAEICKTIFISSPKHYIYDADLLDLTRDGKPELVAMLWKRGNYGGKKPMVNSAFELTDIIKSSHIFIWSMEKKSLKPLWFSSMLSEVPKGFDRDLHKEDRTEGIVYIKWKKTDSQMANAWVWKSWGLKSL